MNTFTLSNQMSNSNWQKNAFGFDQLAEVVKNEEEHLQLSIFFPVQLRKNVVY